jgi:hypothetical protein
VGYATHTWRIERRFCFCGSRGYGSHGHRL